MIRRRLQGKWWLFVGTVLNEGELLVICRFFFKCLFFHYHFDVVGYYGYDLVSFC